MTIQETVRHHIQQHPDMEHLRELGFGCEVLAANADAKWVYGARHQHAGTHYNNLSFVTTGGSFEETMSKEQMSMLIETGQMEIIGHPPRLFEVMKLLNEDARQELVVDKYDWNKQLDQQDESFWLWLAKQYGLATD